MRFLFAVGTLFAKGILFVMSILLSLVLPMIAGALLVLQARDDLIPMYTIFLHFNVTAGNCALMGTVIATMVFY